MLLTCCVTIWWPSSRLAALCVQSLQIDPVGAVGAFTPLKMAPQVSFLICIDDNMGSFMSSFRCHKMLLTCVTIWSPSSRLAAVCAFLQIDPVRGVGAFTPIMVTPQVPLVVSMCANMIFLPFKLICREKPTALIKRSWCPEP